MDNRNLNIFGLKSIRQLPPGVLSHPVPGANTLLSVGIFIEPQWFLCGSQVWFRVLVSKPKESYEVMFTVHPRFWCPTNYIIGARHFQHAQRTMEAQICHPCMPRLSAAA